MKSHQFSMRALAIAAALIALLSAVAIWRFDIPRASVEKVGELHGQTDVSVLNRLGAPSHEYFFTMDESVDEFRIELYNTYPPGFPDHSDIEIRECTWEYASYRLTVWFHKPDGKWIALNTCRYKNGIIF